MLQEKNMTSENGKNQRKQETVNVELKRV